MYSVALFQLSVSCHYPSIASGGLMGSGCGILAHAWILSWRVTRLQRVVLSIGSRNIK